MIKNLIKENVRMLSEAQSSFAYGASLARKGPEAIKKAFQDVGMDPNKATDPNAYVEFTQKALAAGILKPSKTMGGGPQTPQEMAEEISSVAVPIASGRATAKGGLETSMTRQVDPTTGRVVQTSTATASDTGKTTSSVSTSPGPGQVDVPVGRATTPPTTGAAGGQKKVDEIYSKLIQFAPFSDEAKIRGLAQQLASGGDPRSVESQLILLRKSEGPIDDADRNAIRKAVYGFAGKPAPSAKVTSPYDVNNNGVIDPDEMAAAEKAGAEKKAAAEKAKAPVTTPAPVKKPTPKTTPQQTAMVKQLQGLLNINADGIYGPQTQAAINAAYRTQGKAMGITHAQHKDMDSKLASELADVKKMLGGGAAPMKTPQVVRPSGATPTISQARLGVTREGKYMKKNMIDEQIKHLVKRHLREATMPPTDQAEIVKQIQNKLGIPTNGVYDQKTQAAVTKYFKDKGIEHHGHKDWASKLQEEWNEIMGGSDTSPSPTPSPSPSPSPTPEICDVSKRTEDPEQVEKLTQELIDATDSLTSSGFLGGMFRQIPATYAAKVVNACNLLKGLAANGKIGEVYAVDKFQIELNMTPTVAYGKAQEQLGSARTAPAIMQQLECLKLLEDTYNKCGMVGEPGGDDGSGNVDMTGGSYIDTSTNKDTSTSTVTGEGKVIFKKSYVQKIIREELNRELKKKNFR